MWAKAHDDAMTTAQASLCGRDVETRRLDDLMDRVRDRGTAMLVQGEPGIGKSALLEEARQAARARGMRILTTAAIGWHRRNSRPATWSRISKPLVNKVGRAGLEPATGGL
jgi:transcriptional regulator of acetoin/glycerol metabolism